MQSPVRPWILPSVRRHLLPLLGIAVGTLNAPAADTRFQDFVQPTLTKNCAGCHNDKVRTADLSLSSLKSPASVGQDPETWEKVIDRLRSGTMPPKGLPRPPQEDLNKLADWFHEQIAEAEKNTKPDPGRVTARRLNRAEYNNTLRDLLGVNFRPADDFPQDDSGYGFDNIGDVLSLSPVLLEKYLKAADTVVRTALYGPDKLKPTAIRAQPPGHEFELTQTPQADYDVTGLSMPNALHATMHFPAEGDYVLRIALEGRRPNSSEPVRIGVWIDGKQVQIVELNAPDEFGGIDLFGAQKEFKLHVTAGDHWVAAAPDHLFEGLPASYGGPNPSKRPAPAPPDVMKFLKIPPDATPEKIAELKKAAEARIAKNRTPANRVWVHWVEALGPYDQKTGPSPETLKKVYTCGHLDGHHQPSCERTILSRFARRAFRRPVTDQELQPYFGLVASARKQGAPFEEALGTGLQAILVSPQFLFRLENLEPVGQASTDTRPINQYALASRLSYFLWSSTPDDELLQSAEKGTLRQPAVLSAQVRRMLKDPKSRALVENFAGQWLELRRLDSVAPDREKFPQFDDYLRFSMRQETETFFSNLVTQDRSIMDLLDAKYTFVNEKLARFYGLPNVKGVDFQKVDLNGTSRSGVLTQASVLTVSSYATRTSPVLRGKWILENILNAPVPPPPPNVPALDEAKIGSSGSMRQQLEEHRKNPACASCHSRMDPLGFAFENFSAIGEWRTKDGKFPVDPAGALPDGRKSNGPGELTALLTKDRTVFADCVINKLLTYALGRGLERYDKRTVRQISDSIAPHDYRFSELVLAIVNSLPFQMGRGETPKS